MNNKIIENMIAWAINKLGSIEYNGWCLSFIEDALEISNELEIFWGDSAKESAILYSDEMKNGEPINGAFVFYDCLSINEGEFINWGHCGICIGDGKVIHAWNCVRIDDYKEIEKLKALSGDYPKYIGWVDIDRVLRQKKN